MASRASVVTRLCQRKLYLCRKHSKLLIGRWRLNRMPGFVRAAGTVAQACTFIEGLAGLEDFTKYFLRLFPLKTRHFEEG